MLNPSTANAVDDDPTIRKLMSYMRQWYPLQVTGEPERDALESKDHRYRYSLTRTWKSKGYVDLVVVNLYAYRATQPKDLWQAEQNGVSIVGESIENPMYYRIVNDKVISSSVSVADHVIAAWGCDRRATKRADEVIRLLLGQSAPIEALELSKDGHPKHPLFLRKNLKPCLWKKTV